MELLDRFINGDRRALARVISLVENGAPQAREILKTLYPRTGQAHIIGFTGAPGVGKSTLVNRVIELYRGKGKRVGVVAVDPSSPFTGGAILGDRIRMQGARLDEGVFIRSLATRGHLGGLSQATGDVAKVLDAAGFPIILVETVGTGQSEVEIMRLAHTTVVVLAPGMGDDIQVIKAGILEIGDVFAVNKADREGTDRTVMELEMMLDLAEKGKGPRDHDQGHQPLAGDSAKIPSEETGKPAFVSWRPPIIKTVARDGVGIEELLGALESHLSSLKSAGRWDALRQAMGEEELLKTATELAGRLIRSRAEENGYLRTLVAAVARREMDPFTAAEEVLRRALIAQEDQGRSR